MCVHSLPRTLVFIGGSHGLKPAEPTYGTSEEATHGEVEAVEPTGLVGRPGWSADGPGAPTAPSFVQQAVLSLLVLTPLVLACIEWSELGSWATLGPFEPESVLC